MVRINVNEEESDPYKNFKFRVKWEGRKVAGFSEVTAPNLSTEMISNPMREDQSKTIKSPGQAKFEAITLERGITYDPEFESWANLVHHTDGDAAMSLKNFRKDIIIELLNEQGNLTMAYKVYRCWVSHYTTLPDLDASGNAVAIESMVLQNEGWKLDREISL